MTPGYGVFVAGGMALGAVVIWASSRRVSVDRTAMMNVVFWTIVGGIVGARLLFVLLQWHYFSDLCLDPSALGSLGIRCTTNAHCYPGQECDGTWCRMVGDCFAAVKFWQGGWVFLGGVLGAFPAALLAARLNRVHVMSAISLLTLGLPVGHVFGRVGCMVKGCCFGKHTDSFIAIAGRHPTQLYEALGELAIFAAVFHRFLKVTRNGQASNWAAGSVLALYITLYPPLRFVIEMLRGDYHRGYLLEIRWPALAGFAGFSLREPVLLTTSQAISLALFTAVLVFWWRYRRKIDADLALRAGIR